MPRRAGKRAARRVLSNIREGRLQRSLALVTAASALPLGVEIWFEHYRGSFGDKWMWTPVALSPALTAAGVAGVRSERAAKTWLPALSALYCLDGVIGVVKAFNDMGLPCHLPRGSFYAFPCIKSTGLSSKEFAWKLLEQEKVACVPGGAFGVKAIDVVNVADPNKTDQFVTRFTLPVSKDNYVFGILAIDKDGNPSPASFPQPWRPGAVASRRLGTPRLQPNDLPRRRCHIWNPGTRTEPDVCVNRPVRPDISARLPARRCGFDGRATERAGPSP